MKIGIITINIHTRVLNFASPIHTVAFQHFLDEHGIDSTIIDYQPKYYGHYDIRHPLFYYIDHPDKNAKKQKKLLKKWKGLFYLNEVRYDRFQEFIKKYYVPRMTEKCYTPELLNKEDPGFDCYICATDIIWKRNRKTGFEPGYFLSLGCMKGKKKIAYSPSRGNTAYTMDQEKEFLELIADFDYLSAREKSLQEYINGLTGLHIPQVLDPVFLNDVSYYQDMMIPPKKKPDRNFILIYIVMQDAKALVKEAVTYAAKHNLEVIELSEELQNADIPKGMHHEVVYDIGIEEWLWYMQNATQIFTNSFHCCCFSILMHKDFFAGDRGGDKIDSLLDLFELSWRRLHSIENLSEEGRFDRIEKMDPIDYDRVDNILREWRKHSEDYILGAIHDLESRDHRPILPNVKEITASYPEPSDPPETVIKLGEREAYDEKRKKELRQKREEKMSDTDNISSGKSEKVKQKPVVKEASEKQNSFSRRLKNKLIVRLGGTPPR